MDIKVENVKCNGCANTIKHGLLKIKGVNEVNIDIENGVIHVENDEIAQREEIVSKLHAMGYPEPGKGSGLTTATSFVSCMIGRVSH
jgi:copper chaperone CopZ